MESYSMMHCLHKYNGVKHMRILVTGANGFIGNHMVEKFKKEGHLVAGMDISATKNNCVTDFYILDILKEDVKEVLHIFRPDIIVHCAGLANVPFSLKQPMVDFQANTTMVYRLLEGMRQCELVTSRFILLSSAAVYGQPKRLPIKETDNLKPMSPYALHKKMAEDICLYYVDNYHLNIRILRVFSAYGPGLKKQLFWDMYQKIQENGCLSLFGTGEESRDYIYIDDLVEAISLIALDRKTDYTIWNVANGQEIFIKHVADVFAKRMGIESKLVRFTGKIREGDPINWCADISRLQGLGYIQNVDIVNGIDRYVEWAKEREWLNR